MASATQVERFHNVAANRGACSVPRPAGHAVRDTTQACRTATADLLRVENVTVNFGGFKALNNLNFSMQQRELRVVI
jgi:hypothetical protein